MVWEGFPHRKGQILGAHWTTENNIFIAIDYSRLLFIISYSILNISAKVRAKTKCESVTNCVTFTFNHIPAQRTFCVIILLLIESYEGLVYVYILVKIYLIFLNLKCCPKERYYYTFLQGCPAVCTKAECI